MSLGLCTVDGLHSLIASGSLPAINYINLRKSKISTKDFGELGKDLVGDRQTTLVLDGLKLAGSNALQDLLGILCYFIVSVLNLPFYVFIASSAKG